MLGAINVPWDVSRMPWAFIWCLGIPITLPFGQLPTGRSLQNISLKREMLSASKDQTLTGLINPEDVKSHQTRLS